MMAACLLVLAGCSAPGYHRGPVTEPWLSDGCDQRMQAWTSRVMQAQAFEAQYSVVAGYPYLRVDRFWADRVGRVSSETQRREWLHKAWQRGWRAWQLEARMLGAAPTRLAALAACGQQAVAALAGDAAAFARMADRVRVPDDYRTGYRVMGLYALLAPFARWRIEGFFAGLEADFGRAPLPGDWVAYGPPPIAPFETGELQTTLARAYGRSSLGVPVLAAGERARLFATFAPTWEVQTRGAFDRPGTPFRKPDGTLGFAPAPVVYQQLSFTGQGAQARVQLSYLMWFSRRPPEGALDILAGALDGVFWRVTLDDDGQPLWFDSIHACGCFHLWFPVRGRTALNSVAREGDTVVASPARVFAELRQARLRLASGNHYLTGVEAAAGPDPATVTRQYVLRAYDRLRVPSGPGVRLFDVDGLVPGSERPERFLFWPLGIASAGGMRQWGHHATAFVGRRHFDDPDLFERYFTTVAEP